MTGQRSEGRLGNMACSRTRASPSPGEQSAKARSSSSRERYPNRSCKKVREGRIARLFDRGAPVLYLAQASAFELETEAITVEAHLYLTGVPGGHRSVQPLFEHRRKVAKEPREVGHAHVVGVMVVAVEPVQRRPRDGLVEG